MLSIECLPESSFVHGYYGLEPSFIRGIVRIMDFAFPIHVNRLKITLKSYTSARFVSADDYEYLEPTTVWWSDEIVLLGYPQVYQDSVEVVSTSLDIPFEFALPENTDQLHPVLPMSHHIEHGGSFYSTSFNATTRTILKVELTHTETVSNLFSLFNEYKEIQTESIEKPVELTVFYPQMIPKLFFPDVKQWRSNIGAFPCEFDFQLSNSVVGPGDELKLSYRIAICNEAKALGIKVKSVRFQLKQVVNVGDNFRGAESTCSSTIGQWEQFEFVEKQLKKEIGIELVEFSSPITRPVLVGRSFSSKDVGRMWQSSEFRGGGSGDGFYAESEGIIKIPIDFMSRFNSSTPKSMENLPKRTLLALVQVKHMVRVDIEFHKHETKAFECNVNIIPTGLATMNAILLEFPDIVPSPEYDRVVGGAIWLPLYQTCNEYATC